MKILVWFFLSINLITPEHIVLSNTVMCKKGEKIKYTTPFFRITILFFQLIFQNIFIMIKIFLVITINLSALLLRNRMQSPTHL